MATYNEEFRMKIVKLHLEGGRTIRKFVFRPSDIANGLHMLNTNTNDSEVK